MELRNPLIPGFNPDPSIVRVDEDFYLATSSFEYLPGIPIHHSRDLESWDLIGHVATRSGQLQMVGVPTAGGAWAPTIRWRDGTFYVVVTDAMGRGTIVFTATDPGGPWSDGMVVHGVDGIDPDLAWDGEDCYMTYSGLLLGGAELGRHLGIQQVRLDLETGTALERPRSLWSGTGLMFPEAPHLYRVGDWWYLMIAEGGTERGHAISIARSSSPSGPFEGCPHNPVLSARSTDRPIQNTGHGDLVQAPDGSWAVVLLGMRTRGMTRAFSSLGRETFATEFEWVDGWPVMAPVTLARGPALRRSTTTSTIPTSGPNGSPSGDCPVSWRRWAGASWSCAARAARWTIRSRCSSAGGSVASMPGSALASGSATGSVA